MSKQGIQETSGNEALASGEDSHSKTVLWSGQEGQSLDDEEMESNLLIAYGDSYNSSSSYLETHFAEMSNEEDTSSDGVFDDDVELDLAIRRFVEQHSDSVENVKEALMDIGIFVTADYLQQTSKEALFSLVKEAIYQKPSSLTRIRRDDLVTLEDLLQKIKEAKNIVVVSGAGISVSCGIPDFRSSGGIYEKVMEQFSLIDPQEIFDIETFKENPQMFFSFAKEIMPSDSISPSLCHRFIRDLEKHQKLLRDYTQNIDGLERMAGIDNVIYCHGSFSTAHCLRCGTTYSLDDVRSFVMNGELPLCLECSSLQQTSASVCGNHPTSHSSDDQSSQDDSEEIPGIIKPDIVFFGEPLRSDFFDCFQIDKNKVDLLLVIGTSLQVAPVSKIPFSIPLEVPQVLINLEPVGPSEWFDLELIGPCDCIIEQLYRYLGWELVVNDNNNNVEIVHDRPRRYIFQPNEYSLEQQTSSEREMKKFTTKD